VILNPAFLFSHTMSPSITSPSSQWASILSKFEPGNAQVLVASVPIYGHFEKLRVVAADLVQRGYQVSFITGAVFRESVEKIGARFVALEGTADFDSSDMTKWPERELLPAGPEQLCWDLKHVFIDHMADQYWTVQHFLAGAYSRRAGPVVMVQDTTFLGAFPVLLGAPGMQPAAVISIGITPIVLSSIDTAPFNSGLPPDSSEEGRIRNIAMRESFRQMFSGPQDLWVQSLKQLKATDTPGFFLDQLVTLPHRYLQLSIEELEYPRSDAPDSLKFIGALPSGKREATALPSWWNTIVEHERPVVVVSQGTASNDPKDLIIPTLEALKDLDVLVVATLVRGDHIEGYELPTNVLAAKFIPFDELFKSADVVVNNGGYGTIQQAFSSGVPMVLAGMSEDKPEACARAAWTGAAINLATNQPTPSQVRAAVEKVLNIPRYKARALELQKQYLKTDCFGDIAATINELALAAQKRNTGYRHHFRRAAGESREVGPCTRLS
jgi:UDP:flavonoid glycosyltransferase YjiC (YdhE family)